MRRDTVVALVGGVLLIGGCGGGSGGAGSVTGSTPLPSPTPTATASATPPPVTPPPPPAPLGSLGAIGWAATAGGTTGGDGATAAKTYTVRNRSELIQALYGGTARINADGSFSGTPDAEKKIVLVAGTISLNMDAAHVERTADDYVRGSCAQTTHGFTSESALATAYQAAYRPSKWGIATLPSGKEEAARVCAATQQRRTVVLQVPSNTSIIGLGTDAKIVHGNLSLGGGGAVDNIVIRNIAFEDSFDFFPQWDPTDSGTGRWNSAYDLISITNATHVWIDRSTFSDGARQDKDFPSVWNETVNGVNYAGSEFKVQHHDGLIDPTRQANLVTISHSLFRDHDKSFLIGGTDTVSATGENPTVLKVTFHDNWFRNLRQRQPRVRYGQVHLFNNYFEGTRDAAAPYPWLVGLTVGQGGKIHAENNVFAIPGAAASVLWSVSISASRTAACVTAGYSDAQCASTFFDSGTVLNGVAVDLKAAAAASNAALRTTDTWQPATVYAYTLKPTATLAATVMANAGAGRP